MKIKKCLTSFILIFYFLLATNTVSAIPNPWTECGDDISCAANIAGFNFPLRIKNYSVRAMKDMIELTFSIDRKRTVTVRKSLLFNGKIGEYGIKDISGDYNNYPFNKIIWIEKAVPFSVKGYKNKFYTVNFAAETGNYSITCKNGLKLKDIKYFYKLLKEAEASRHNFDETNHYTIKQLQDLRRINDTVEPVFTHDCFPRSLQKKGVTKNCFERANLGQDIFCSASEIKMIKKYYKKGRIKII